MIATVGCAQVTTMSSGKCAVLVVLLASALLLVSSARLLTSDQGEHHPFISSILWAFCGVAPARPVSECSCQVAKPVAYAGVEGAARTLLDDGRRDDDYRDDRDRRGGDDRCGCTTAYSSAAP